MLFTLILECPKDVKSEEVIKAMILAGSKIAEGIKIEIGPYVKPEEPNERIR